MTDTENESLNSQINRLANFIMENVPGEPSQNQGAVDTAIRIMEEQLKVTRPSEALFLFMGWLTSREEVSGPFSSKHDASQAAKLVGEYCKIQGWKEPRESTAPGSWGEVVRS